MFNVISDTDSLYDRGYGGCTKHDGIWYSVGKQENDRGQTIDCTAHGFVQPAPGAARCVSPPGALYDTHIASAWAGLNAGNRATIDPSNIPVTTIAAGDFYGTFESVNHAPSGHSAIGGYVAPFVFEPSSGPAGEYQVTTRWSCIANAYHIGTSTVVSRRLITTSIIPVTLDLKTPTTVDFGKVMAGGGEILRDLPMQFTSNGDTTVQFSLQAPPFDDGSKYTGALGSYAYTVYSDSSWVRGGPKGTLSILGDWNSLPVKMGTSSYKLKVGLKPMGKPFVAGTHSTNLTVTAHIL